MKTRQVVIFSGETFTVPQGIQRIDTRSTHGWQVRYHGTKMFSDHTQDGSGAALSLVKATQELLSRIAKLPAPNTLQERPSANKKSDLPSGISGPIVRQRRGSALRTANFSVLVPRFGQTPRCRTVYIGNENTYDGDRYTVALAKAVAIRQEAEQQYELDATKAKRKSARDLKAHLAEMTAKLPKPVKAAAKKAKPAAKAPASAAKSPRASKAAKAASAA